MSTEEITEDEYKALEAVLKKAHKGHRYVTDQERYGVPDLWKADLVGDCEDFALWIRYTLDHEYDIQAQLVFCSMKEDYTSHHVVVHYKGFILDNRYSFIMPSDLCEYNFMYIGESTGLWYEVENNI